MVNKKLSKSKIYAIVGVTLLILAIAGTAYAYYQASATASIAGEAAGAGLDLNVTKISTSANKNLIPLTNTVEMLTKSIKGYGNTGSTFDSTKSCIDKNGNTVCQVYEISLTNNSSVSVSFDGGATLSGDNTPNIACAVMDSNISISSNNTCVGKKTIANNDEVLSGQTKKYYVIVYVNNLNTSQSDNGVFNGTITFTSSSGAQLKARFEDDDPALGTLTRLGLTVDTSHTPDFTTCSGNSCICLSEMTGDATPGQGDSTNGIYSAKDDLGTSYYFRGAVENNYVSFAGKTWRIVRINGDGTIRIALNGSAGHSAFNETSEDNAYVGYMYGTPGTSTYAETHSNTHDSTIKSFLDDWYDTNLSSYSSYIADSIFCNDRSLSNVSDYWGIATTNTGIGTAVTAYSGYKRTYVDHNPSLICPNNNDKFTVSSSIGNGALTKAIGLLTTDEYIMAGAGPVDATTFRGCIYNSSTGAFYLYDNDMYMYWSMSPDGYRDGANTSNVLDGGNVINDRVYGNGDHAVRPAVSLKSDAITGGNGTSGNPFVVS